MKMPKLAKDWVRALRSGKYKQTNNRLKRMDPDEYCCLGVACDVSGFGKWVNHGYSNYYRIGDTKGAGSKLAYKVRKALGISTKFEARLIELNDVESYGFPEIADAIEQWYKAA